MCTFATVKEKNTSPLSKNGEYYRLVNDISEGLPAEIKARRKQYEYYREKLLTFNNVNN